MIKLKPVKTITVSKEAYELFDNGEWANLLKGRGIDSSKKVTYHVTSVGVVVKQWDLPAVV
jgi:hypothetical protein